MIQYKSDCIVAISTAKGKAGISVLRISGENAFDVVDNVFRGKKTITEMKHKTVQFGKIYDGEQIIDEVVVTKFVGPNSFTGENVVEISCHGNDFIANIILELLLKNSRLANPGEFTQRAFFNNKIDLTQAEAIGDLLNAKTRQSHLSAISHLEGKLYKKIKSLLDELIFLRTIFELEIDFQEQGLDELDEELVLTKFQYLEDELDLLIKNSDNGLILRDGFKISLVGSPNVGKSSIFNAFLDTERAIVTPHPGTTRDYLEEAISLDGFLIRIFDTAGIRDAIDEVEKIGIERSFQIVKDSHRIIYITDGQSDFRSELKKIDASENRIIKVLNKIDILSYNEIEDYKAKGFIPVSAVKENGLKELKNAILKEINISNDDINTGIISNIRQINAAKKTFEMIKKAKQSFIDGLGVEFVAFDIQEASSHLEEIIGKVTVDGILDKIFSEFCIGK